MKLACRKQISLKHRQGCCYSCFLQHVDRKQLYSLCIEPLEMSQLNKVALQPLVVGDQCIHESILKKIRNVLISTTLYNLTCKYGHPWQSNRFPNQLRSIVLGHNLADIWYFHPNSHSVQYRLCCYFDQQLLNTYV